MSIACEIPIIDLNKNLGVSTVSPLDIDGEDDDVFISEKVVGALQQRIKPIERGISKLICASELGQDVACQTGLSVSSDCSEARVEKCVSVPRSRIVSYAKPRKRCVSQNSFCWRHDAYENPPVPARPSTPSAAIDVTFHRKDVSTEIFLDQTTCTICRTAEEKRLSLRSRCELLSRNKVLAEPTVAAVKHCPSNLLQQYIPNCSDLWVENQTFYLGTSSDNRISRSENTTRARIQSVPIQTDLTNKRQHCYYCEGSRTHIDLKHHPRSYCRKHSFRIRSLSLTTKEITSPLQMPKWTESPESGRRDWLLVQRVTKKIPADAQSSDNSNPYYCEFGSKEMIFCLHNLRTIRYIEDVCCQHFLAMSRQEALEKEKTIELLFSSQGPVLRDDKHLKGRSLFYFCFHVEKVKPKRSSSRDNYSGPKTSSSSFGDKFHGTMDHIIEVSVACKDTATSLANSATAAGKLQSNKKSASNQKAKDDANSVSFGLIQANNSSSSANAFVSSACSANGFNNIAVDTGLSSSQASKKKRGPIEKRSKKRDMRPNLKKDGLSDKHKKTVTFSDELNKDKENRDETPEKPIESSNRRASLPPPPPKLNLPDEEEDTIIRRKKRERVTSGNFTNVASPRKTEMRTNPDAPRLVASYQRKEWKTIRIAINFKNKKFSKEFFEYKSLQDLYMWLRQELLREEILTPGADLMLTYQNLKFPLKANTATNVLSSLPTTAFDCQEIIKANASDGGFGESSSKYDTRFALPLDTRDLVGLNPVQYLNRYCIVSNTWRSFYLSIFSTFDKLKNKRLGYREVCFAMERLFVELAYPLLSRVIKLMGLDQICIQTNGDDQKENEWKSKFSVGPDAFVSMCSLANRIICREDEIDGFHVDTIKQRNTHLEDADFFNIEGKIRDYNLDPLTKQLLLYVRNKTN